MGKINSAITFIGKVGNINGYNRAGSVDKTFVRLNGGATKEQFLNSVTMARTRENANEFSGISALAGVINRRIPRPLRQKGGKTFYFIIRGLRSVLMGNNLGVRGYRSIIVASDDFISVFLNKSFSANNFESRVVSPFSITFPSLKECNVTFDLGILHSEVIAPSGATHYVISLNGLYIANRVYNNYLKSYVVQDSYDSELISDKTNYININDDLSTFSLNVNMNKDIEEHQIFIGFLSVVFFQQINTDYILYGGASDTIITCVHI